MSRKEILERLFLEHNQRFGEGMPTPRPGTPAPAPTTTMTPPTPVRPTSIGGLISENFGPKIIFLLKVPILTQQIRS